MDIIFIGSLFPKDREHEIHSKSKLGVDYAANNLQWAFIDGLCYYYHNINLLTLPAIGSFPKKFRSFYFNKSNFSYKKNVEGNCLGFINIPGIKHLYREWILFNSLKKIASHNSDIRIIIYSIHSPFLKAAIKLKKKNRKIKICLIVPDLPQYMSENRNPIYLLLKKIDLMTINSCLKEIDSFVLLSNNMYEPLDVKLRPYTRIEGIFAKNRLQSDWLIKSNTIKSILYTGSLDMRYGILNLLDAFASIKNENYELWICGDGNCKNEIIQRAQHDNRIKYFGIIQHSEILKMQKEATVLINPRTSVGEFTKYSFPSKTMEYLASGTPCIMHKLPGVPEEYFEYVYLSEKEDAEGLNVTINNVLNKTQNELDEFGKKASEFILEKKNPIVQVKKIYDMINTL